MEAGIVQEKLLSELCAGLDKAEDVDLVKAEKLIDEMLVKVREECSTANAR
jgi:hypothetical protein